MRPPFVSKFAINKVAPFTIYSKIAEFHHFVFVLATLLEVEIFLLGTFVDFHFVFKIYDEQLFLNFTG